MIQLVLLAVMTLSVACLGQTTGVQKAIICLTYDDGLQSQLTTAIPQLDSAGLHGTFFLNSIEGSTEILGQGSPALFGWRKASQNGHELGNHTLFHPCLEKFGWQKEIALEGYSMDELLMEIRLANSYLEQIDRKKKQRSFAYPCNNTAIRGVDYSSKIRELNLVRFARGGGDQSSLVSDLKTINFMQVPSWHVMQGTPLSELIEFAEKVKKTNGLGIYQFHGIGGPLFEISSQTHRDFLKYLKENDEYYSVLTFSEAMELVEKQSR